ncbi:MULTISPECIES: distal tail protein Dit [unclassified Oceanobacillus]|uniref:distal tail protein Dit n=1 Tax=unclassified Oceanobacillus TaxID=2630292 RepID=UPI001BE603B3|nr:MULTISPECIES: distal tail protein Dit [unclassified Oceanobacillus]MBT2599081.1 phage tail family protein [Oceanobacillus sp. ISL-74]MBT2651999.1 phage tail family protein [Oceanobacillus sp. ISL-73]
MLDMTYEEYMGNSFIMWHDDVDYSDYFVVLEVTGRSLSPNEINSMSVSGMDGSFLQGKRKPGVPLKVKVMIREDSPEDLRTLLDKLNGMLDTDEPVPIRFSDEPDKTYYGMMSDISEGTEVSGVHIVTITFWRGDPYKYGGEQTLIFPTDMVSIPNNGTADTEPVFELTAKQKTTLAMVTNGDGEYNLIGKPVDENGHEQIIDTRSSILYENGNTLDSWSSTENMVDDYFIDISGEMMTDGAGIRTQLYGTGEKMHGPAIMKELPKAIQDFEIESTFDIISERPIENFRMEIYFHDENMNMLGKLGIKDDNRSYLRRRGLGRVGEYRGGGESNGYVIGEHNYSFDDVQETTLMYLRVKREGEKYTFYIAQWRNHKHIRNISDSFMDVNNQFQGKLKYITLFIGKYQDRPNPNRLRINSIEVFELARLVEDQTPYILNAGDVVTFDHKNDDILVNGEPRNDLKNFGSSFFELKRGDNIIGVTPTDCFDTKVTYSDKFK